jgi:hypothetical protein
MGAAHAVHAGADQVGAARRAASVAAAQSRGRCPHHPPVLTGGGPVVGRRTDAFRLAAARVRRVADGDRVRAVGRVVLVRQPAMGNRPAGSRRRAAVPLERCRLGPGHLDLRLRRPDRDRGVGDRFQHSTHEQHRARLRHRRRPGVRDRAGGHGGHRGSDRRRDGVSRHRDARPAGPARRGGDGDRAGRVLRGRALRSGARHRQHRPRVGAVGGWWRVGPRRLPPATDRTDDPRPRDLQRGRADHRPHRRRRAQRLRVRRRRRCAATVGAIGAGGNGVSGRGSSRDTRRGTRVGHRRPRR